MIGSYRVDSGLLRVSLWFLINGRQTKLRKILIYLGFPSGFRYMMNVDNAIKIGNYVEKFMELEKAPDLHRARKFLRRRVMMHTHVELKIGCFIQKEDGQKKWLQFRYKRLAT